MLKWKRFKYATHTHTRLIDGNIANYLTGPNLGIRNGPAHEAGLSADA